MTVAFLLRPLNAQTVFVTGSYAIPSGFVPAGMDAKVANVFLSKMTTAFAPPSLMYPNLPS